LAPDKAKARAATLKMAVFAADTGRKCDGGDGGESGLLHKLPERVAKIPCDAGHLQVRPPAMLLRSQYQAELIAYVLKPGTRSAKLWPTQCRA